MPWHSFYEGGSFLEIGLMPLQIVSMTDVQGNLPLGTSLEYCIIGERQKMLRAQRLLVTLSAALSAIACCLVLHTWKKTPYSNRVSSRIIIQMAIAGLGSSVAFIM